MSHPTDKVFTGAGRDWHNRAMIGFMGGVHWSVYVEGYKEAADRLVAGIDEGRGKQDFLVFPILHLYRHYLELSLKANIRMCQVLLGIERPSWKDIQQKKAKQAEAAQGHNLEDLYHYLLSLLPRIDAQLAYVPGLARIVAAFAGVDPGGDQTRYPVTIKDQPSLATLKEVNLRQLAQDMATVEAAFTNLEGGIDYFVEQAEYRREMELEMEAEFRTWDDY